MKKTSIFLYVLMILTLTWGCSSDDDKTVPSDGILGKWEMELGNSTEVLPGESIFTFQNDGTLSVTSKSKDMNDVYLLPSGTYHYSINKDEITFSGNSIKFQYIIEEDKLQLTFSSDLKQDNVYLMYLQYKFHRKKII